MKIHPPSDAHTAVILLIEDNEADARLVRESLKSSKILNQLIWLKSGIEALDYLHARGDYTDAVHPDLILLDLNMPKMDGREFLENIKGESALTDIPLVVLTTSEDENDIIESYENSANCFITKPLDFSKFVDVVQAIEHFWFKIATMP